MSSTDRPIPHANSPLSPSLSIHLGPHMMRLKTERKQNKWLCKCHCFALEMRWKNMSIILFIICYYRLILCVTVTQSKAGGQHPLVLQTDQFLLGQSARHPPSPTSWTLHIIHYSHTKCLNNNRIVNCERKQKFHRSLFVLDLKLQINRENDKKYSSSPSQISFLYSSLFVLVHVTTWK